MSRPSWRCCDASGQLARCPRRACRTSSTCGTGGTRSACGTSRTCGTSGPLALRAVVVRGFCVARGLLDQLRLDLVLVHHLVLPVGAPLGLLDTCCSDSA